MTCRTCAFALMRGVPQSPQWSAKDWRCYFDLPVKDESHECPFWEREVGSDDDMERDYG